MTTEPPVSYSHTDRNGSSFELFLAAAGGSVVCAHNDGTPPVGVDLDADAIARLRTALATDQEGPTP